MILIAGIGVLLAGLVAIGLGIQDKEFEVGRTLILAGTAMACTGILMLGLSVAIRELRNMARRLGPAYPAAAPRANSEQALPPAGADQPPPASSEGAGPAARQAASASGQEEAGERDRARLAGGSAPETAAPEPAAPPKPKRNLLFSSSRRERERLARPPEAPAADPAPRVTAPAPKEAAPSAFEDAWPQADHRARSDALRRTRAPSTFAEPNAAPSPAPERTAPTPEPAPVTVLKSGVVDGMAYSLYSDGSIEAQMPEGMMRFASIDELRSHLDQRP